MTYLLAYDISRNRRRARVARVLERHGLRCQKSVFLIPGGEEKVRSVVTGLAEIIDVRTDCVQAWRLSAGQTERGIAIGSVRSIRPHCAVIGPRQSELIDEHEAE